MPMYIYIYVYIHVNISSRRAAAAPNPARPPASAGASPPKQPGLALEIQKKPRPSTKLGRCAARIYIYTYI